MKILQSLRTAGGILLGCVVAGVLGLAALEAYLRLTIPDSTSASIFEYTLDTKRYKVMRASASIQAWGRELRTNRLGFRDNDDHIPPKRPGEYRIVVLGDSFTVSAGVDYGGIYTTLLERALRSGGADVRVINLAVAGYNVLQYEMVLHEVALALEPDLVLVAVFPTNDFTNETLDENYRRARGEPAREPGWFQRLYVYQAYLGRAEARVRGLFAARKPGKGREKTIAQVDPALSAWDENATALARIAEAARERRIAVAVTALPHTFHFERQRALHDRVHRFCAERGIPAFDMLAAFAGSGVRESALRLNPIDSHPNEAYNALVARHLAAYLVPQLPVGRPEQGLRASAATMGR